MPSVLNGLSMELAYLKVLYESTDGGAVQAVFCGDISCELDWPSDRADEVAYFWVDRGVLAWAEFGQVAFTPAGLKKAAASDQE